jgi:hypothetical protein
MAAKPANLPHHVSPSRVPTLIIADLQSRILLLTRVFTQRTGYLQKRSSGAGQRVIWVTT